MHLPDPLVAYLNGRAAKAAVPVQVEAISFPEPDRVLVRCRAMKFGITAAIQVRGRLESRAGELTINEVVVEPQDGDAGMIKRKVLHWFSTGVLWRWGDALEKHGVRLRK